MDKSKSIGLKIFLVFVLIVLTMAIPACAENPSHNFTAVSCGNSFVLSLRDDGTVWTWGKMYGEVFDKQNYWVQPTPIQVPIEDVVAISAGWQHCLALKKDGSVWSWGSNDYGQLGDGTTISPKWYSIVPVRVIGLDNVTMISAGPWHSLALKNDGTVWSWGANGVGNLGDGTLENRNIPVQVTGLNNITAIYSGYYAKKDDSTMWTWGMTLLEPDSTGHVSVGSKEELQAACKPTPFQVPGLKNVKVIVTEDTGHTVFVKEDGTVWSWGYVNLGRLGDGSQIYDMTYTRTPVQAKNLGNVKMVAASDSSSIALKNDGTVWVWGNNGLGQLGIGRYDMLWVPTQVKGLTNVSSISASNTNAVFIRNDGSVWICGDNSYGQKGDGTSDNTMQILTPVRVLGPATYDPTPTILPSSTIMPTPPVNGNDNMSINVTPAQDNGLLGILALGISAAVLIIGCVVYLLVLRKM